MNSPWFEEEDRILAEINVTPLVDVALVLLIAFMITAPMLVQGAQVRLPETQRMDMLSQDQMSVTITSEGQVQVNGEAVPIEDLEARLSPLITPGRNVLFYGDAAAQYGVVMRAVGIAHSLGATVNMVTDPISAR